MGSDLYTETSESDEAERLRKQAESAERLRKQAEIENESFVSVGGLAHTIAEAEKPKADDAPDASGPASDAGNDAGGDAGGTD